MVDPMYHSDPHLGSKAVSDTAMELGQEALDRTTRAAAAARDTVEEHPVATLAIIAGLAFAVGALWKIGQSRQQTRVDSLLARAADLKDQLPRSWRM